MAAYGSVVKVGGAGMPVPEDKNLKRHHVKGGNGETVKFQNPHPSAGTMPSTLDMVRRILWSRLTGNFPTPDTSNLQIPVVKPTFLPSRSEANTALRATWLGHACYYVEFPSGLRVLFDPVFEDRCAPSQWAGPKRLTPPACELSALPAVDAVVISHSHYDHLSHGTVSELAKLHPEAQFFVGLGLARWFRSSGISKVTELDWWEDAELTLTRKSTAAKEGTTDPESISARISCLPCQHSSGRTPTDKDRTLWASWAVNSGDKSVWFGGDTGYRRVPQVPSGKSDHDPEYESLPRCPQFRQIGELRGPFDLGLIPIGAYKPRHLFSFMHADPYDAVEIFRDTRCKRAMGIHWGTWVLTSEEVEEPARVLREALRKAGLPEEGVFDVCGVGESREF